MHQPSPMQQNKVIASRCKKKNFILWLFSPCARAVSDAYISKQCKGYAAAKGGTLICPISKRGKKWEITHVRNKNCKYPEDLRNQFPRLLLRCFATIIYVWLMNGMLPFSILELFKFLKRSNFFWVITAWQDVFKSSDCRYIRAREKGWEAWLPIEKIWLKRWLLCIPRPAKWRTVPTM